MPSTRKGTETDFSVDFFLNHLTRVRLTAAIRGGIFFQHQFGKRDMPCLFNFVQIEEFLYYQIDAGCLYTLSL
jgi:hypothetical protein